MDKLIFDLRPRSAFGGPVQGDTLFGQLCWAIRNRFGEARLRELLAGYTQGQPFAVCSDALPRAFFPRPAIPLSLFNAVPDADRKQVKERAWVPVSAMQQSIPDWLGVARSDDDIAPRGWFKRHEQNHNSINRLTGTTGKGAFAPYTQARYWVDEDLRWQVYVCHDPARIDSGDLAELFWDIGVAGYGRDASIGLGKFELEATASNDWPSQAQPNAYLSLAACAPQGKGFSPRQSFYQPFTRFGRHGDIAVQQGNPFKTPVLLAATGGLFTPREYKETAFVGQGLGGEGLLSKTIQETVQQGYCPVLPVRWPGDREPSGAS